MRKIEKIAVDSGTSVETLMEQAGRETAAFIVSFVQKQNLEKKACIIAGTGNNGGDGYVVARYLLQEDFTVQVVQAGVLDQTSLTKKQRRRYEARGGKVVDLANAKIMLAHDGVIVDALFGTGLNKRLQNDAVNIIQAINSSKLPVIAVDIPSGLNAETGEVLDVAVKASVTCTMEFPKRGFFFDAGWNHVGDVVSLPIGLKRAAETLAPSLFTLETEDAKSLLPPIVRNRHKYERGFVVGLAGSHGMAGAALMTSLAALKAGAGIVHLLHPEEYSLEFCTPPLEVVKIPYAKDDIQSILQRLEKATGVFIGPGLGTGPTQAALLEAIWPKCSKKMVVDADALTWLSSAKGAAFGPLPNAILTPHLGELHRFMTEKKPVTFSLIQECQKFADDNVTNLILKGGPSFLFSHGSTPVVQMQGDPGMATAGAGDVLTGILAALLSEGLSPRDAMLLGSWLHGTAGECGAKEETSYSMTALSIINHLPDAFKLLLA